MGERYTDAVELVHAVLHEADYYDHEAAGAVLDALTAPGSPLVARIRAQAGEDAARALMREYHTLVGIGLAVAATPYGHAAAIVREVTGSTEVRDG